MQYRQIIKTAWGMTNSEKGLIWYGVIPAFFSLLVGLCYSIYQVFAFRSSPFFGNHHMNVNKIESLVLDFVNQNPGITIALVVISLAVIILYFLLPPLCEGGLIGLVSAIHREKKVEASDGIAIGAHYFLRRRPILLSNLG